MFNKLIKQRMIKLTSIITYAVYKTSKTSKTSIIIYITYEASKVSRNLNINLLYLYNYKLFLK